MVQNHKTYRIEGLSCANCAGKFEKNVNKLTSVEKAQVNFGASKIYVTGQPTLDELEHAGSFENLKIIPDDQQVNAQSRTMHSPVKEMHFIDKFKAFYHQHETIIFAAILVILGYISQWLNNANNTMTLILFTLSIVLSGSQLIIQGVKNLLHFEFDMRTLMTIAIIGGVLIGQWGEVAVVVILFAISEALEQFSMDKARQSMASLMEIAPDEATILRRGQLLRLATEEVEVNDILYVKPGQKIALDGIVVSGHASVNQAAITGESMPVDKRESDEVYAGTLNEDGVLEVKVTKASKDTALAKMIQLVEAAQVEKAPAQAFVEKFAKYYTPCIMVIAFLVAILPPLLLNDAFLPWIYQGLSVLVVGCPCALVIATPISIVSSIGNAAKNGVLIKGGIYLEQLSKVQTLAFDKTGTLTVGHPVVTEVIHLNQNQKERIDTLGYLSAVENLSNHPIARAVVAYATEKHIDYQQYQVKDFLSKTGQGVRAVIEGNDILIGQPQLFHINTNEELVEQINDMQKQGDTVILMSINHTLTTLITVRDQVREQSQKAIEALQNLGIQHTVMLTGDNLNSAQAINRKLKLTNVEADLMPEDKLKHIEKLEALNGPVGMVGDGVNDAPALARASIGIAMGGASTDTALETADIALLGDDMSKLPFTYRLSRKTMNVIKANIVFAIGIKLIALLLVIPGWLTLWIAIFSDMGATLIVALNAIRLLYVKDEA
ncbi:MULTISPECIES: heavy metal translocating P-type ATPase [Staphylococcus]|uniref:Cd(2+)-exporting ATPase n=1 Tax=Staphylococcus schleiferi TaxID=1295 RepID=A0A7Z7QQ12_STASC|nr:MULTISPECIES: heavy metal translocating P-type ATPase [Staphylococcus]QGS45219.1 heavy metal translocating P-type ATPase [Mammaliicoccus fleurettii]EPD52622.1 heavy metal translocating P-type ATPase [Staphylococcus sp. HGB0015]MBF1992459.1 heavy metal translocating P-type ATPase [Staphylococcus schleiferi]MBF2038248.1 heavy metal translocating P-type ATPase [Staphylococcus schleiferi]MBF2099957.1 heavy metal translocating P-type ATPase [Staphylococcus schleiferi]